MYDLFKSSYALNIFVDSFWLTMIDQMSSFELLVAVGRKHSVKSFCSLNQRQIFFKKSGYLKSILGFIGAWKIKDPSLKDRKWMSPLT